MASCGYAKLVGEIWGSSADHPANVHVVQLGSCNRNIKAHLKSYDLRDSTSDSEVKLLLARAGRLQQFRVKEFELYSPTNSFSETKNRLGNYWFSYERWNLFSGHEISDKTFNFNWRRLHWLWILFGDDNLPMASWSLWDKMALKQKHLLDPKSMVPASHGKRRTRNYCFAVREDTPVYSSLCSCCLT